MGTGYAIVRRKHNSDELEVIQIVWGEEEAVEFVNRLNAFGPKDSMPHSWQVTWVARPDDSAHRHLTPTDREYLDIVRSHGALDTERPITVTFSFIFNRQGAFAACDELGSLGWPRVGSDEEVDGDDCWHAYGIGRRLVLSEDSIARLREEMEDLAERHGGTFDGWDLSGRRGGLRSPRFELPV
jgi:hypothetical protein